MYRIAKLLPLAAALAIASTAGASIRNDTPSLVVKYDARALKTREGVVSLHARIRNAAQAVCSPLASRVLGLREQYQACVNDAITQSVAAINNPNLSLYHRYGAKAQLVASN